MTTSDQNDNELEQLMSEDSELCRRYRQLNDQLPPARLDADILNAARAELSEADDKPHKRVTRPAWMLPVSIAAVMVLSVSLVTTMQYETSEPATSVMTEEVNRSIDALSVEMNAAPAAATDSVKPEKKRMQEPAVEYQSIDADRGEMNAAPAAVTDAVKPEKQRLQEPAAVAKPMLEQPASAKTPPRLRKRESFDALSDMAADSDVPDTEAREADADFMFMKTMPQEEVQSGLIENQQGTTQASQSPQSKQEDQLVREINALLSEGRYKSAKNQLLEFRKSNPEYSDAAIEELLGSDIYQLLNAK